VVRSFVNWAPGHVKMKNQQVDTKNMQYINKVTDSSAVNKKRVPAYQNDTTVQ